MVQMKRIYEAPEATDGSRVLVDRLWPRGVSKERADLTAWLKQVAPSTELREWYGHDPAKFDQFTQKYKAELQTGEQKEAYAELKKIAAEGPTTLLTATKDADHSEAAVLVQMLRDSE